MRILRRLIGTFVVVLVVLLGAAYLLPREVTVSRSVVIDAPPAQIFPHVNALQATQAWSPWLERDPNIQVVFSGPESGVGNAMEWRSEVQNVGNGSQQIVESTENEKVVTALDFGDMGTARAALTLEPQGGSTQVTWTLDSDMGNSPIGRYMGLMMNKWVGADYELGLSRLKVLAESGA